MAVGGNAAINVPFKLDELEDIDFSKGDNKNFIDGHSKFIGNVVPILEEEIGTLSGLNNEALCDIYVDRHVYPSVEHAFLACRAQFCFRGTQSHLLSSIMDRYTVREQRQLLQGIRESEVEVTKPAWFQFAFALMERLLVEKFLSPSAQLALLETGDFLLHYIGEHRYWCNGVKPVHVHNAYENNTLWTNGVELLKGENQIGAILMHLREFLKNNIGQPLYKTVVLGDSNMRGLVFSDIEFPCQLFSIPGAKVDDMIVATPLLAASFVEILVVHFGTNDLVPKEGNDKQARVPWSAFQDRIKSPAEIYRLIRSAVTYIESRINDERRQPPARPVKIIVSGLLHWYVRVRDDTLTVQHPDLRVDEINQELTRIFSDPFLGVENVWYFDHGRVMTTTSFYENIHLTSAGKARYVRELVAFVKCMGESPFTSSTGSLPVQSTSSASSGGRTRPTCCAFLPSKNQTPTNARPRYTSPKDVGGGLVLSTRNANPAIPPLIPPTNNSQHGSRNSSPMSQHSGASSGRRGGRKSPAGQPPPSPPPKVSRQYNTASQRTWRNKTETQRQRYYRKCVARKWCATGAVIYGMTLSGLPVLEAPDSNADPFYPRSHPLHHRHTEASTSYFNVHPANSSSRGANPAPPQTPAVSAQQLAGSLQPFIGATASTSQPMPFDANFMSQFMTALVALNQTINQGSATPQITPAQLPAVSTPANNSRDDNAVIESPGNAFERSKAPVKGPVLQKIGRTSQSQAQPILKDEKALETLKAAAQKVAQVSVAVTSTPPATVDTTPLTPKSSESKMETDELAPQDTTPATADADSSLDVGEVPYFGLPATDHSEVTEGTDPSTLPQAPPPTDAVQDVITGMDSVDLTADSDHSAYSSATDDTTIHVTKTDTAPTVSQTFISVPVVKKAERSEGIVTRSKAAKPDIEVLGKADVTIEKTVTAEGEVVDVEAVSVDYNGSHLAIKPVTTAASEVQSDHSTDRSLRSLHIVEQSATESRESSSDFSGFIPSANASADGANLSLDDTNVEMESPEKESGSADANPPASNPQEDEDPYPGDCTNGDAEETSVTEQ